MYRAACFRCNEKNSQAPTGAWAVFCHQGQGLGGGLSYPGQGNRGKAVDGPSVKARSVKPSLEFPGGVVETRRSAGKAAARDWRRTGYFPGTLLLAGAVYPNPAIQATLPRNSSPWTRYPAWSGIWTNTRLSMQISIRPVKSWIPWGRGTQPRAYVHSPVPRRKMSGSKGLPSLRRL
jgi:ribosomal protein L25 (general stress protein Ctc)